LFCCIFFIIGKTRSYHFLWAPTCLHFKMCSCISFGSWHLRHLCKSVASGDIFAFCHPVLSQPSILFEVFIRFKGPSERYWDFIPFQSMLFHVELSQSCLSCRYAQCLLPCMCIWIQRYQ
jgi:hypothetical protein